jgi:transposase-like protein
MMEQVPEEVRESLDELVREGARRMLLAALEAEVEDYVTDCREARDADDRALVVRNGRARERRLTTGAGVLSVRAPRVNDRRPGERFTSAILPPYMRRSPRLEEALPVLYLRGLSTGDVGPALKVLLGQSARGLSATTVTRLKEVWKEEYRLWRKRDLSGRRYAYVWADGVNFSVRLETDNLKCLVLVGVTEGGRKEVIALEEGYRESEESWKTLLRDLKRRGLEAPLLAVGDGALGFWNALGDVFVGVSQQRCWKHKLANVLDKLPKRLQGQAKAHLHEIMYAPDRATADAEVEIFKDTYEAKYPKAVASLTDNLGRLLTFFDYPAEHWVHLRTTNPIESTFGTVKARTKKTRGAGSRAAGLAMAFKLIEAAEQRWRRVNAPHLVAAVLHGVQFKDGERVRPAPASSSTDQSQERAAA